jgi:hypothetical protein
MDPKKYSKGPQVDGMYGPMSKHKNRRLTKSSGPLHKEKKSQTTRKQVFCAVFGPFGAIGAPKKIYKGPQVGKMFCAISELKNKPLTKSLVSFF